MEDHNHISLTNADVSLQIFLEEVEQLQAKVQNRSRLFLVWSFRPVLSFNSIHRTLDSWVSAPSPAHHHTMSKRSRSDSESSSSSSSSGGSSVEAQTASVSATKLPCFSQPFQHWLSSTERLRSGPLLVVLALPPEEALRFERTATMGSTRPGWTVAVTAGRCRD